MSDLRTELSGIQFNDEGENVVETKKSKSLTKQLFFYITDNPNVSASQLYAFFGTSDSDGISARLYQLYKRGLVTRYKRGRSYLYKAKTSNYKRKKYQRRDVQEKPAQHSSTQSVLNSLSVVQARELYEELRKIFSA